jgi:hypothetical protein
MRTKTLFLTAAVLAAGIASSMAQSNVYSVNIVGYYSVNIPANTKTVVANQLDNGTNTLNDLLAALPNKSSAYIWNGSAFPGIVKTSGSWPGNPTVAPGTALFVQTPATAGTITNVFIGSAPTSNNVALPDSVKLMVAGRIPFSGNMNDFGGNTLNLGSLPNKSSAYIWNGSAFPGIVKTSGSWPGNPAIATGSGLFIASKGAATWIEWIQ